MNYFKPVVRYFKATTNRFIQSTTTLPTKIPPKYKTMDMIQDNTFSYQTIVQFRTVPKTVLIVKKPDNDVTKDAMIAVINHLRTNYVGLNVLVEPMVSEELNDSSLYCTDSISEYSRIVDFVITIGGDGTILHTSSLFPTTVPPILSFSMGSLGFLLPFKFSNYPSAIAQIFSAEIPIVRRMRLGYSIYQQDVQCQPTVMQVMNDITIHRGQNSQLASMDCYVGLEHLTDVVADGLIVSTPTGSTAYSLSAGGPIVHPLVDSILLTPICPRSLSFRPILLPSNISITLKLSPKSKGSVDVIVDGRDIFQLSSDHSLEVTRSPYFIPCVKSLYSDWLLAITKSLRWNQSFINSKDRN